MVPLEVFTFNPVRNLSSPEDLMRIVLDFVDERLQIPCWIEVRILLPLS